MCQGVILFSSARGTKASKALKPKALCSLTFAAFSPYPYQGGAKMHKTIANAIIKQWEEQLRYRVKASILVTELDARLDEIEKILKSRGARIWEIRHELAQYRKAYREIYE